VELGAVTQGVAAAVQLVVGAVRAVERLVVVLEAAQVVAQLIAAQQHR
jgi:hypothetical protein